MTDVDYFKRYNDHYGHLAGEEFVVLLPATPFEALAALGERLRANVEALEIAHAGSGVCKHVTISVGGAATVPQRDDELLALIEVADQALYKAKHAGRNRIVTRSK